MSTPPREYHRWRWRVLAVWIVVFSVVVGWGMQNLSDTKADISNLKATNCALVQFLVTAREARLEDAKHARGSKRAADLQAAYSYKRLIDAFGRVHCRAKIYKSSPPSRNPVAVRRAGGSAREPELSDPDSRASLRTAGPGRRAGSLRA